MPEKISAAAPSLPPEIEPFELTEKSFPQGLCEIPDQITSAPRNTTLSILQVNRQYENTVKDFIASQGLEMFNDQREVFQFKKEQLETIRKKTEQLGKADTWSDVSEMASYFTNASTLVLAVQQLTTGGIAAPLLLAAGGIGISSRLIDLLGGWDWISSYFTHDRESQQELSDFLKKVADLVSLGAFLISSGYAYTNSTFDEFSTHAKKILTTASTLFASATHSLSNIYSYLANNTESLFQTLKDNEIQAYIRTVSLSSSMTTTTEEKEASHKKMQAIILTQTPV